jgi:murein DD-endopeptidase MepM/ murein hydrolase activator NlpD
VATSAPATRAAPTNAPTTATRPDPTVLAMPARPAPASARTTPTTAATLAARPSATRPAPASAPATSLATLVAQPAATGATAPAFRYVFPLAPPDAGRYPACHHDYPAADIFAPIGTRFVAVTDGVVDFVSATDPWDPAIDDPATRGGLAVAIVGDDGVRYYGSHLSAVAEGLAPGLRVTAGQILGATGDSGNAAGTDPHLHFGISRPTTPDDWAVRRGEVAPQGYLAAWRAGRDIAPDLAAPGAGVC